MFRTGYETDWSSGNTIPLGFRCGVGWQVLILENRTVSTYRFRPILSVGASQQPGPVVINMDDDGKCLAQAMADRGNMNVEVWTAGMLVGRFAPGVTPAEPATTPTATANA